MFKVPIDYQCAILVFHAVTPSVSSCPAMLGRLQDLQEQGQPAERGGPTRGYQSGTAQRKGAARSWHTMPRLIQEFLRAGSRTQRADFIR